MSDTSRVERKKLFIVDPLSDAALGILGDVDAIELVNRPGLSLEEKLVVAADAHGIIVRSQTNIGAEFLEQCKCLEIIVRAGVGVDNIDVDTATRKGVVVQNIPEGNIRSAAEHAVAMMLALARNIPQACASLKAGEWNRKAFVGSELKGKTLGIVGLGKIGRYVLHMAVGLGMKPLGFDPFISPEVASDLGVPLVPSLTELASQADFLTIHVPLSAQTRDLINHEVFAAARRGLNLIHCARGGIVDEKALLEALKSGAVAGAALDVFEKEPPDFPELIGHPRVIPTPHLGASTLEAQQNVAVGAAQQMVDYFRDGNYTSPVNAQALEPAQLEGVQPYRELGYRLGLLQSQLLEDNPSKVRVGFAGDLFDGELQSYLCSAVLCGFLKGRSAQPVNPVNAQHLASEMGLVVEAVSEGRSRYFHQMVRVAITGIKKTREVAGTIRGQRGQRVVALDDYHFDAVLEGNLLIIQNEDRPGMIGVIGQILAASSVNISYMSLGRDRSGGTSVALLNLDAAVPPKVLTDLAATEGIRWAKLVTLPD